ncbi:MAG: PD40 domain-containing protein [Nitrospinae bacterium]|nr:PD40 domain-containing protein [Nitrospinota bacterium]
MKRVQAMTGIGLLAMCFVVVPSWSHETLASEPQAGGQSSHAQDSERHLANIRQLTVGGKNAEAYFSFDGDRLIFQSTKDPVSQTLQDCHQMYVMDLKGENIYRVSTGYGGTTCGYFFPGGRRVLFSSTHMTGLQCPPKPQRGARYRWVLDDYDIFSVKIDGRDLQRLTSSHGYDAEATISPNGRTMVFTSVRDGDIDLYTMNIDGSGVKRLTNEVGYEGGAFFSPDSKRIVYRAQHPKTPEELKAYKDLLAQNLIEPGNLELFVMNADGSEKRQVTFNGASNFAPYFYVDGRQIIFSSNVSDPPDGKSRPAFQLHLINDDGTGMEQITFKGHFNSFPMFSPDGKLLVWVSDRNTTTRDEFNVFLADWVP